MLILHHVSYVMCHMSRVTGISFLYFFLLKKIRKKDFIWILQKNLAHRRQCISRPMRIVAQIPQWGGARIPQNPIFLKNRIFFLSKTQKLGNLQKYAKIRNTPFNPRFLSHRRAWFPCGPRIPKNPNFLKNRKNHPKHKNSKMSRNIPKLAIRPSTRGL